MNKMVAILALSSVLAGPALAQAPEDEKDQGLTLMEDGARMILRGLMADMEPAIDGLRGTLDDIGPFVGEFMREMGPGLSALATRIDDIRHYSAPEFLPNGDIILRRKPDAPDWQPDPEPDTDPGAIEL